MSYETLARLIIMGTYDIPSDMDPATKLILEEISKLGIKIVNGERNEIIIMPDYFKHPWRKVNKFTLSSMSGVNYGHYKAAIQDEMSSEILALQTNSYSVKWYPTQKIEHRPAGNFGEDSRSLPC